MIQEYKTHYMAEWIDDEDLFNDKYLGDSIDVAISEAHKLKDEMGVYPFIVEIRKEKRVIMHIRK